MRKLTYYHKPGLLGMGELILGPISHFVLGAFFGTVVLMAFMPIVPFMVPLLNSLSMTCGLALACYYVWDLNCIRSQRCLTISQDKLSYQSYSGQSHDFPFSEIEKAQWISKRKHRGSSDSFLQIKSNGKTVRIGSMHTFSCSHGRYSYFKPSYYINDEGMDVARAVLRLKIKDRATFKLHFSEPGTQEIVRQLLIDWGEYEELWLDTLGRA